MPNIKNRIKCNCDFCNEEIEKVYSEYHKNKRHFCNKECSYAFKKGVNNVRYNKVVFNCHVCGKEGLKSKSQYDRAKKHFCSQECFFKHKSRNNVETMCRWCGKKITRQRSVFNLSAYHFCTVECKNKWHSVKMIGDSNPAWFGGVTSLRNSVRNSSKYQKWRMAVFERDDYICKECNKRGGDLHVHHIMTFSDIIEKYGIDNIVDAMECKELWNIDNGITYCVDCHKIVHKKLKESV